MSLRTSLFTFCCLIFSNAHALYDPPPVAEIAVAQGEWSGQLTYDDYSEPGKIVTLPTRAFLALETPTRLVLHYVFDDGPHKTVYAYESMNFDLDKSEVTWLSGVTKRAETVSKIVSQRKIGAAWQLVFEHPAEKGIERYSMELSATYWSMKKEEVTGDGAVHFRDKYEFQRKAP